MSAEKEGGSKTDPLARGRCLHESVWYRGSNMELYGIAESWHFYPAGHDQVDPMLYMHLYRIGNL